ncbi:hypothetical protein BDQ17DRAFT_1420051 [Cyathus striatus]|nr:hypothetical protein BDQ17DRAFT_1420051 [Cyathus striatus]
MLPLPVTPNTGTRLWVFLYVWLSWIIFQCNSHDTCLGMELSNYLGFKYDFQWITQIGRTSEMQGAGETKEDRD